MSSIEKNVLPARAGYNLIASKYANWHWYGFWRANEGPIIKEWLKKTTGSGIDAGCGNAPYLTDYSRDQNNKFLIDFSEGMIREAKKRIDHYKKYNPNIKKSVHLIQADIKALPIENNSINYILCSRVFSNVSNFKDVLDEFIRVLKPNGKILLTDIHPHHTYEHTGVNTDIGRINIETYKHEIKDLITYAYLLGLKLDSYQEFNLLNIRNPPPLTNFEKIYRSPSSPIFFVLELSKSQK